MDLSLPRWRKPSFSGPEGECVEVAFWRKSSYSALETDCVEVAFQPGEVGVRDSKNPASGALVLTEQAWRAFNRRATEGARRPRP